MDSLAIVLRRPISCSRRWNAANAVADVQAFWEKELPADFGKDFAPVRQLTSYDSTGQPFKLCGSSTAGLVSGTLEPTQGCVHIAGVHVNGTPPEGRARLGVCTIPEGRGIFANLTVAENLRMMTYRTGVDSRTVEERAYGRFPRLGERRSQLAGTLSGGEQQMLAMARAVATDPSLLLLDEISMGLAPMIVSELYELVGQLAAEGISILLVEQFVKTAMSVADYVGVMTQGRIERVGEGVDVADVVSAAYMGALA